MDFREFLIGFREAFGPKGEITISLREGSREPAAIHIRWDEGFTLACRHMREQWDLGQLEWTRLSLRDLGRSFAHRLAAELKAMVPA